jgi:hypothetical protein
MGVPPMGCGTPQHWLVLRTSSKSEAIFIGREKCNAEKRSDRRQTEKQPILLFSVCLRALRVSELHSNG